MDCSSPSVGPNPAFVTNGTSEGLLVASGDGSRVAKKTDHPAGDSKSGGSLLTPKPGAILGAFFFSWCSVLSEKSFIQKTAVGLAS